MQSIPKDIEPPAATAETTTTTAAATPRATTANRVSSMSQRRERLTRDFESGTTCTPTKFLPPSPLSSSANMSIGLACQGERLQR